MPRPGLYQVYRTASYLKRSWKFSAAFISNREALEYAQEHFEKTTETDFKVMRNGMNVKVFKRPAKCRHCGSEL